MLGDRKVSSDSQSNRVPFAGRLYVIVLDDQDVSAMRTMQVKKTAKEFVERYMGANDIAAVVHRAAEPIPRRDSPAEQSAPECRHRQVHGSPHALARNRAARRVLPAPLDDPE